MNCEVCETLVFLKSKGILQKIEYEALNFLRTWGVLQVCSLYVIGVFDDEKNKKVNPKSNKSVWL
jgi:hypothetical protein